MVDASKLKSGVKVAIDRNGIIGGENKRKDGCCVFGASEEADFLIPESENCGQRHFVIQYNYKKGAYYLKDLKEGTGTSVKLNWILVIFNIK